MAYTTIDDPSLYFQTLLYTGNDTARALTNDGNSNLQPDWVWIKNRNTQTYNHKLFDSSRGATKILNSDQSDAESTTAQSLTAFSSDGFSVGTDAGVNKNAINFAAWQWAANGGTTASNSDGGITSTVQVNSTAGFSIILYTGTGSTSSVGHGLGDTPDWILYKRRSGGTRDWMVYHQITGSKGMILNSTSAGDTASSIFGGNTPTSTTIPIGSATETNTNGESHIAYAFAEKQGYSRFGTYQGNGSSHGPFVYLGFKPAWLMYKRSSDTGNWRILDNRRNIHNIVDKELYADSNSAEAEDDQIDFFSNGFQLRNGSSVGQNGNNSTYIYMAFAESPFVSSEGVPTTAF